MKTHLFAVHVFSMSGPAPALSNPCLLSLFPCLIRNTFLFCSYSIFLLPGLLQDSVAKVKPNETQGKGPETTDRNKRGRGTVLTFKTHEQQTDVSSSFIIFVSNNYIYF